MTALARRAPAAAAPSAFLIMTFALLGIAAVVSPVYTLAAAVGLVFLAVCVRDLAAGVAVFAVLTFFTRLPGSGTGGGGVGVTSAKIGGAILVLGWLLLLVRRKHVPLLHRGQPLVAAALVGFTVWAFTSALWAEDPGAAVTSSLRYAQNFVLVFIVFSALRERRHFRWLLWAFVLAAAFTAVSGFVSGSNANATSTNAEASARLVGKFGAGDPNFFAALLLAALVFTAFLFVIERRWPVRAALLATGGVLLIALFQTESRGGLIALAVTGVLAVVLAGRFRARAFVVAVLVAVVCVTYFGAIASPQSRARVTRLSLADSSGRNDLWRVGLAMAADHPVLGVGSDNFTRVSPQYAERNFDITSVNFFVDTPKVTHNTYLNILDELGAPGLALLALAVAGALIPATRRLRASARDADFEMEMLARAIVLAIVGMLVASFFYSGEYQKQLWLLIGAAAAVASGHWSARAGEDRGMSSA